MNRSADALAVVGRDLEVPLVDGRRVRAAYLDSAASARALQSVRDAVDELLPYYSSIHRGAGFQSRLVTELYEQARDEVSAFVGARADDVCIFTRNTTDAMNLLASALPLGTTVVTFETEHHANLLPWRRHRTVHLPAPYSADEAVAALDRHLAATSPGPVLVAVTGAGNVTGEVWPVARLVEVAHRHGAPVVVDAAQLAPHAPVDLAAWDADWVALSGHKLYAPFGAGALVGRPRFLCDADGYQRGGGAVQFVTVDGVEWSGLPARHEGGTPNLVGAVALGVACRTLRAVGMDALAEHERVLGEHADKRLADVPGLRPLLLWGADAPRIGTRTFVVDGYHHALVGAVLAAEHGVSVRTGCFCAHPLMLRLLEVGEDEADRVRAAMSAGDQREVPGGVRASFGVCTSVDDVDRLADALCELVVDGPRWTYRWDDTLDTFLPEPDPRPTARLTRLAVGEPGAGAGAA